MSYLNFRKEIYNHLAKSELPKNICNQQMEVYDNYFSKIYDHLKPNEVQELLTILKNMNINKFELFTKVIEYEFLTFKDLNRINLLREVKRINSGLVNTKIINKIYQVTCEKTYGDFLRALKLKTIFFVEAELNGKKKVFLAKADIGKRYFDPEFGGLYGWHNLLLDPVTLKVYQYNRRGRKKIVLKSYHERLAPPNSSNFVSPNDLNIVRAVEKEIDKYVHELKENYIKHYSDPLIIKKEVTRERAKKRIENIFSKENVKKKLGIDVSHSHASHKLK